MYLQRLSSFVTQVNSVHTVYTNIYKIFLLQAYRWVPWPHSHMWVCGTARPRLSRGLGERPALQRPRFSAADAAALCVCVCTLRGPQAATGVHRGPGSPHSCALTRDLIGAWSTRRVQAAHVWRWKADTIGLGSQRAEEQVGTGEGRDPPMSPRKGFWAVAPKQPSCHSCPTNGNV